MVDLAAIFNNQVTILSKVPLPGGVPPGPILTFDASITENHHRKSVVTEFETENGQTISDHIIVKPFGLTIQGLISDNPLSILNAALTTAATAAISATNLVTNATAAIQAATIGAQALAKLFSPSQGSYQQLLGLQEGRFPFDVVTTIGVYTNMWIADLSIPRDKHTGAGLIFNLELVQLILVTPLIVPTVILAAADIAQGQVNKGPQAVFAPSDAPAVAAGFGG